MKPWPDYQSFIPLPSNETIRIAWPTPNHALLDAPEKFFARTRVNPDYGKPGWTRDCGKRFHRGCDVAPTNATVTGQRARVTFTDCTTHRDFDADEPVLVPHDEVFCVLSGRMADVDDNGSVSDFGKHLLIEHTWPESGEKFYTLYAHLQEVFAGGDFVRDDNELQSETHLKRVRTGELIGEMGQTSGSADGRNWLAIAPHLHFEVRSADGNPYDPVEFLRKFLLRQLDRSSRL
jgi:murein DD-endopeptidase MepM/ murein hydrolase activator NlpD